MERKNPISGILLFCLLLSFTQEITHASHIKEAKSKGSELVIGIFPRRGAEATMELFTPLADYLSDTLSRPVKLETSKNFESFWQGVAESRYDIVHFNQYHYVKSRHEFGYRVISKNEEFGEDTIASSLVVREDAGIQSLADLKGKKIVFGGDRSAMQSYIGATYLLRQAGINASDYDEAFSKNPPNAIFAAFYGQAAAGGTGDKVLQLPVVTQKIDINKMKYIARGAQLPHLPWAVSANVPIGLRKEIQSAFAALKETDKGKTILAHAKLTGLNKASDRDYDEHRKIIFHVLNENYCMRHCSAYDNHNEKLSAFAADKLILGVFPRHSQRQTLQMFTPLAEYLSLKLNKQVELHSTRNYEQFWDGIVQKRFDIAHLNQYQYLKSAKLYDYELAVKNIENNSPTVAPAIIVRANAGIDTVAKLKNKHVMFAGDKTAMIAYIGVTQLLRIGGLNENDYIESFNVDPAGACRLLLSNRIDACGASADYLNLPEIKASIDVSQLKVLTKGDSLPQLPWVVNPLLPQKLREQIVEALLRMKDSDEGRKSLQAAKLSGFETASDEEYDVFRQIIENLLHESF